MPSTTVPQSTSDEQYSLVQPESFHDSDHDSDSSTVANSISSLEKGTSLTRRTRRHLSRSPRRSTRTGETTWQTRLTWIRWIVVVVLQTSIIGLLVYGHLRGREASTKAGDTHAGGDINGLYQEAPRVYRPLTFEEELYMPNMTSNDNRDEIRQRWNKLFPLGSGSIAIEDWKQYPLLGDPIEEDGVRKGSIYEASWTHSLHCLYASMDNYHQLIVNGITGNENHHHASHCFEYLRQSILCNVDMTLEGNYSAHDEMGGQMHVCRNRDHAVKWLEDRRLDDIQDIVGP